MFALPYRWVTQIKFISDNNTYSEKDPQFRFFYAVKGEAEVSLEPAGSRMPSAQNNLHIKMAHEVEGGLGRVGEEGLS